MTAILVMVGYFSFAVLFGMALMATMRDDRVEANDGRTKTR
ncbi:MAG TPA: hypothetical protein VHE13_09190 [Opitutus sp.]|nr:hypothetical protein [Opitutus sp.]